MAKKKARAKKASKKIVKKPATKQASKKAAKPVTKKVALKKTATQKTTQRKVTAAPVIKGNMNVSALVDTIAAKTALSKTDARAALGAVVDSIQSHVGQGKKVILAGFGSFERGARKARTGRNPQTGEQIQIQASKYPKFRPGKLFRKAVGSR